MSKLTRGAQAGISLVETLVGVTIGLLLMTGLTAVFVASTRSSNTQTDESRLQESARLAMFYLGRSIRQSGYNSNILTTLTYNPIDATNGATSSVADTITLRRDALTGGEQDCTGATVASGGTVVETYSVATNVARSVSSLYCSNGTQTAELAPGVVNMQLFFGLDADKDGAIDSAYTNAITSAIAKDVAVVRIDLVLAGTTNSDITRPAGTRYCDAYANRVCLTFTSSFLLRNQAGS